MKPQDRCTGSWGCVEKVISYPKDNGKPSKANECHDCPLHSLKIFLAYSCGPINFWMKWVGQDERKASLSRKKRLPWWYSSENSALPIQGAQVQVTPGQGTRSHTPQLKKSQSSRDLGKELFRRSKQYVQRPWSRNQLFKSQDCLNIWSRVSEAEKDRRWSWKLLCIKYIMKNLLYNRELYSMS